MFPDAPLLDTNLADEFFVCRSAAEMQELRDIFQAFATDTNMRLKSLRDSVASVAETAATRELHTLRGSVANLGLARAAARLRALESAWPALAGAERTEQLAAATADLALGIEALQARYAYLGGNDGH